MYLVQTNVCSFDLDRAEKHSCIIKNVNAVRWLWTVPTIYSKEINILLYSLKLNIVSILENIYQIEIIK